MDGQGLTGAYIPAATASLFVEPPARSKDKGEDATADAVRRSAITTGTEVVCEPTRRIPNGLIPAVPMWHEYGVLLPHMYAFSAICADVRTMDVRLSSYAPTAVERKEPVRPDGMSVSEWEAKLDAEEGESSDDEPHPQRARELLAGHRLVVTCNLDSSTISLCTPDDRRWSYRYVLPRVSWASLYPSFVAIGENPVEITFN